MLNWTIIIISSLNEIITNTIINDDNMQIDEL